MDFHNFIRQRKVLISLIAALSVLFIGLLAALLWKEPSGDTLPSTVPSTEIASGQTGQPSAPESTGTDGADHQTQGSDPSETTGAAETEQVTAPAETNPTTDPSGNTGTQTAPPPSGTNASTDAPAETQDPPAPETRLLTCDMYSLYSGQFVEDGKDDLVTNVAAILVTNRSDQFLDLATITFLIDGKEAVFNVSGLPAGRSAWVLEANRMTATPESVFTYVDMVTGFRGDVVSSTDQISITCSGNMLTAKNNTSEQFVNVYVYYRVLHTDGNYLGGITYVVDFGTIPPGSSVEKLAGHFSPDNARIVRIGWKE